MDTYSTIFHRAAERHGGEEALREKIMAHANELPPKSDDRWLAEFTKRVFQAGFNWKVVEHKWEGFEAAFWYFNVKKCAEIDMEDMERLTADKGIVRNAGKIKSVPVNAEMILDMAKQSGSADAFIREWPADNFVGRLDYLNKQGSRLGPNTACYALRFSGIPSFILSKDVIAALKHAGVIDKDPTSKTSRKAVQGAFNDWADESGENLTVISRALSLSIDG